MCSLVHKPMIAMRNKSINPQCIFGAISQSYQTLINSIRALVFVNAMRDMLMKKCRNARWGSQETNDYNKNKGTKFH